MLDRNAFVRALKSINGLIYLDGPSRLRTQSSMIPVVAAVETYNRITNGVNLLALIRAIGAVVHGKKIKYDRALKQLYNSFPNFISVSVNPAFALSTTLVPGIIVVRQPNSLSHQVDAVLALQRLNGLASGRQLLTLLQAGSAAAPPRWTEIKSAANTMSGGNECAINRGQPDDYQTTLASALIGHNGSVGAAIGAAMTALTHPPAAGLAAFTWLEGQINNSPICRLQGLPSAVPSSVVHGAGWIPAAAIQSWVNGTTVFPNGIAANRIDDAKVVLGTALRAGATLNQGGHTTVKWSASNQTVGGVNRPPYIGLGHELVHALHNINGEQPGSENGHSTTALYEYLCVGLGPYAAETISENTLRNDANLPPRIQYA